MTAEIVPYKKADMALKNELMTGKSIYHKDHDVFLDTINLTVQEIHQTESTIAVTKTAIIESILSHPDPRLSHMKGVEIKKLANCSASHVSQTATEKGLTLWTKEMEVIKHLETLDTQSGGLSAAEIAKELKVDPKTVRKALEKMGDPETPSPAPKKISSKLRIKELEERVQQLERLLLEANEENEFIHDKYSNLQFSIDEENKQKGKH